VAYSSITIAVDAMGGDFAPNEIVKGAHMAADDPELNIVLVGKEDQINDELGKLCLRGNIGIKHASEVIGMGEHAARAVRAKPNSSISIAAQLVKENKADALVSAGNTGATMSAALLKIGRIKGVLRPAIAVVIPAPKKPVVLLDVGANADCKPENMVQFANMGRVYSSKVVGVSEPTIGLLSVGEEREKGSELILNTHKLMESVTGFVGNVEGNDIFDAKVDVVVCDGFTGNVALKLTEGLTSAFFSEIKTAVKSSFFGKLGGFLLAPTFKSLKNKLNQEEYGGAYLLGIDGVCVIGHGNSNARAVRNAIMVAKRAVSENIILEIKKTFRGKIT